MANKLSACTFTLMAQLMDMAAVNSCLAAGMIVLVEVNNKGFITDIVSAHMFVNEAGKAYAALSEIKDRYAIIIPQEAGPAMYYDNYSSSEIRQLASR